MFCQLNYSGTGESLTSRISREPFLLPKAGLEPESLSVEPSSGFEPLLSGYRPEVLPLNYKGILGVSPRACNRQSESPWS